MIVELKAVGDTIVEFMRARAVALHPLEYQEACKVLLSSFEAMEHRNNRRRRALKKIAQLADDELEDGS